MPELPRACIAALLVALLFILVLALVCAHACRCRCRCPAAAAALPLPPATAAAKVAGVLLEGLKDQVHIAVRVCDAVGRLAEGFTSYAGAPLCAHTRACQLALH